MPTHYIHSRSPHAQHKVNIPIYYLYTGTISSTLVLFSNQVNIPIYHHYTQVLFYQQYLPEQKSHYMLCKHLVNEHEIMQWRTSLFVTYEHISLKLHIYVYIVQFERNNTHMICNSCFHAVTIINWTRGIFPQLFAIPLFVAPRSLHLSPSTATVTFLK